MRSGLYVANGGFFNFVAVIALPFLYVNMYLNAYIDARYDVIASIASTLV